MTTKPKIQKAKKAITIIKEAIDVRSDITQLYKKYRELSSLACTSAQLQHHDVKRAVDALYYLGGGWPTENTKGRMEGLLDNFAGMYRILEFIGSGGLVEKHLAKHGITVKLDKDSKIKNYKLSPNDKIALTREYKQLNAGKFEDLRDIVTAVILECQELQGQICQLADEIKDNLRPAAMSELNIQDEEYDRLYQITSISVKGTPKAEDSATSKKAKIHESISHFNTGLSALNL